MEGDKLNVCQAKTPKKNQYLGRKTKLISQNKYFKISLIYSNMASSKNLFGFKQIEADNRVDATLIFEEINKELEEYLLEKSIVTDSIDGVFDFLEWLNDRKQKNFKELLEGEADKKRFIKALTRIFVPFLNTKVNIVDKI